MLSGVDDGAQSLQEMTDMARLANNDGIDTVCFTPHSGVHGRDSDPEKLKKMFADASVLLKNLFPSMSFYLGNELYYSCDIPEKIRRGIYMPINGSRYVLVEFSVGLDLFNIESNIKLIKRAGFTPILAHAERYRSVFPKARIIRELKNMGALIQVNSRHVTRQNIFGKCKGYRLFKEGLIDIIASDCHNTGRRKPEMRECYEYLSKNFGKAYADRLTKINPRLVLANREIKKHHADNH